MTVSNLSSQNTEGTPRVSANLCSLRFERQLGPWSRVVGHRAAGHGLAYTMPGGAPGSARALIRGACALPSRLQRLACPVRTSALAICMPSALGVRMTSREPHQLTCCQHMACSQSLRQQTASTEVSATSQTQRNKHARAKCPSQSINGLLGSSCWERSSCCARAQKVLSGGPARACVL